MTLIRTSKTTGFFHVSGQSENIFAKTNEKNAFGIFASFTGKWYLCAQTQIN